VYVVVANDAPDVAAPAGPSTGIGLVAIRERAELLGGTLEAGPAADGGFVVRAFVPYQSSDGSGT
jgi:signal transduction histidine kinase